MVIYHTWSTSILLWLIRFPCLNLNILIKIKMRLLSGVRCSNIKSHLREMFKLFYFSMSRYQSGPNFWWQTTGIYHRINFGPFWQFGWVCHGCRMLPRNNELIWIVFRCSAPDSPDRFITTWFNQPLQKTITTLWYLSARRILHRVTYN